MSNNRTVIFQFSVRSCQLSVKADWWYGTFLFRWRKHMGDTYVRLPQEALDVGVEDGFVAGDFGFNGAPDAVGDGLDAWVWDCAAD